jgi:hypothetical protein
VHACAVTCVRLQRDIAVVVRQSVTRRQCAAGVGRALGSCSVATRSPRGAVHCMLRIACCVRASTSTVGSTASIEGAGFGQTGLLHLVHARAVFDMWCFAT